MDKEVSTILKPNYLPLEILLLKRGKNKQYLREILKISPATISRISKGEIISLEVIMRICEHFDCQIQDVVQFVKMDKEEDGQ